MKSIYLLFLLLLMLLVPTICQIQGDKSLYLISSKDFIVLACIHSRLWSVLSKALYMEGLKQGICYYINSFFWMRLYSCPSTLCCKDYSLFIEWHWHLCWISVDQRCTGLFLDSSLFHWYMGLSLCQYHTVLSLLCSKYQNQEVWVFLFCYSFIRLF